MTVKVVSISGPIAVGKSTIIKHLKKCLMRATFLDPKKTKILYFEEPTDVWRPHLNNYYKQLNKQPWDKKELLHAFLALQEVIVDSHYVPIKGKYSRLKDLKQDYLMIIERNNIESYAVFVEPFLETLFFVYTKEQVTAIGDHIRRINQACDIPIDLNICLMASLDIVAQRAKQVDFNSTVSRKTLDVIIQREREYFSTPYKMITGKQMVYTDSYEPVIKEEEIDGKTEFFFATEYQFVDKPKEKICNEIMDLVHRLLYN